MPNTLATIVMVPAPERRFEFELDTRVFLYVDIPHPVGLASLGVGCESPNKLAVAGGAGAVGTVEGMVSAALSVGFSTFFFRSSLLFLASS